MPVLGDAPVGDAVDVGGDEVDRSSIALTCRGSESAAEVATGSAAVASATMATATGWVRVFMDWLTVSRGGMKLRHDRADSPR